jgi:hypothetical protein
MDLLGPVRLREVVGRARSAARAEARRGGPRRAVRRGRRAPDRSRKAGLAAAVIAVTAMLLALVPALDAAGSPTETLVQQGGKLTATGEAPLGRFGSTAALSADGSTLIVGAPKDAGGKVYVFTRGGGGWTQQAALTAGEVAAGEGEGTCTPGSCPGEECFEEAGGEEADECLFGSSVALSADGDTALVGDPSPTSQAGSAWVFTRSSGGTWTRSASLAGGGTGSGEGRFGRSVALAADGSTALVGDPSAANGRGGAWLFAREGSNWVRGQMLTDGEDSPFAHLGRSVALAGDGTRALLGGPGDAESTGAVWAFSRSGGGWLQQPGKLTAPGGLVGDRFGRSVTLSDDGSTALVGSPTAQGRRGAVWTLTHSSGGFTQDGEALVGSEAEGEGHFGTSVALSGDGSRALIGAPYARQSTGRVAQLTRAGAGWSSPEEGLAGSEAEGRGWLGTAVALSSNGSVAAIGAPRDHLRTGAAWVFATQPSSTVPPPVITAVRPDHGPTAGGTEVVISGADFTGATEVHFGSTTVHVTPHSTTEILTKTPPAPAGTVNVTVTTPTGASAPSTKATFRYEGASVVSGSTGVTSGGVQGFVAAAGGACRVSLAKKRLAVTRYRSVALRLMRSGTGQCRGRLALSYRVAARGRGIALRTIGTASFSIPARTSRVVTVRLSRAGQRWLRARHGRANASVAIARMVPAPIVAQSASVRLSLKRPRTVRHGR